MPRGLWAGQRQGFQAREGCVAVLLRKVFTESRGPGHLTTDDGCSPVSPQTLYKSSWERQKAKGFELRLDSLTFLTAKARRDLASEVSPSVTVKMHGSAAVCLGRIFVSLSLWAHVGKLCGFTLGEVQGGL